MIQWQLCSRSKQCLRSTCKQTCYAAIPDLLALPCQAVELVSLIQLQEPLRRLFAGACGCQAASEEQSSRQAAHSRPAAEDKGQGDCRPALLCQHRADAGRQVTTNSTMCLEQQHSIEMCRACPRFMSSTHLYYPKCPFRLHTSMCIIVAKGTWVVSAQTVRQQVWCICACHA